MPASKGWNTNRHELWKKKKKKQNLKPYDFTTLPPQNSGTLQFSKGIKHLKSQRFRMGLSSLLLATL